MAGDAGPSRYMAGDAGPRRYMGADAGPSRHVAGDAGPGQFAGIGNAKAIAANATSLCRYGGRWQKQHTPQAR